MSKVRFGVRRAVARPAGNGTRRGRLSVRSRPLAVCVLAALFAIALPTASSGDEQELEFTTLPSEPFGEEGTGDGQLRFPTGIIVDSNGDVSAVDSGNDRIQEFGPEGGFLSKLGSAGSGDGQLNSPWGIAVDSEDNIWVVDTGNFRIEKFSAAGEFLLECGSPGSGPGQFNSPLGIAVDPEGDIWVADASNNRIEEFSSQCQYLGELGSAGGAPGQFRLPADLAFDSEGDIWVADAWNNRIQELGPEGEPIATYGSSYFETPGSDPGQFDTPLGIAIDLEDNVWVVDLGNDRVQKLSPTGPVLGTFGKRGSGPEELMEPFSDLAATPGGDIWVADFGNSRIQHLLVPPPPAVRTEAADVVNGEAAVLKGTIRPEGLETTYQFEYGPTVAYGETYPPSPASAGSGSAPVHVTSQLGVSGLEPETTYHYRLVAGNAEGTVYGDDRTLTTTDPSCPYWVDQGSGESLDHQVSVPIGGWVSIKEPFSGGVACAVIGAMKLSPGDGGTLSGFRFDHETCQGWGAWSGCSVEAEASPAYSLRATVGDVWLEDFSSRWVLGPGCWGGSQEWRVDIGDLKLRPTPSLDDSTFPETLVAERRIMVGREGGGFEAQLASEFVPEPDPGWHYGLTGEKVRPKAITESVSGLTNKATTLNGAVNPEGFAAEYRFEYGPTAAYGAETSWALVPAGVSNISVPTPISGLSENTTYHYRLVARSETGARYGEDQTFKTVRLPKTFITSHQPTYTAGATPPPIAFESDEEDVTFKCAFDAPEPEATCTSPYELPEHIGPGWHTFAVIATDAEGHTAEAPTIVTFSTAPYPAAPATSRLTSPEEGRKSGHDFTLSSEWAAAPAGGGIAGVTYQIKLKSWSAFRTIPANYVRDAQGNQVSWPLEVSENPGHAGPVYFDARAYGEIEGWDEEWGHPGWQEEIQLRAVFDGGVSAAGASAPVTVSFNRYDGASSDATEEVGPVDLDLVTGNFTIKRTDVSIPVPGSESNLEFTRVFNSANSYHYKGILGRGWESSAPVEGEYAEEAWQKLLVQHRDRVPPVFEEECWEEEDEAEEIFTECERYEAEAEIPEANWVDVLVNEGVGIPFDRVGAGEPYTYVAPEEAREFKLTKSGGTFVLVDPNGTHTFFTQNPTVPNEYQPSVVSFQGSPGEARMVYQVSGGKRRLDMVIAPSQPGVTCSDAPGGSYAPTTPGCRSLKFNYYSPEYYPYCSTLGGITYYDASGSGEGLPMVGYNYEGCEELKAVWYLRAEPALIERYEYTYQAKLAKLTPPGQKPWEFDYYYLKDRPEEPGYYGPLKSVSRATLLADPSTATTTIAYGVPLDGEDAPYDLSPAAITPWDQSDYPVDATAIFPPTEVPDDPPDDYSQATIHYMDPEGHEVNIASPSPPGVEGDSVATSETDAHGNVVRALSAQNRLEALASEDPVARSHELDTHSVYNGNGTRLLESWGPLHAVRLENGETVEAREHAKTEYDQGAPTPKEGEPWPNLPTKETVSAEIFGQGDVESSVTETHYNWQFKKPTEEVVDPQGLDLVTKTVYNSSGQVVEERQPSNPEGGGAGTTVTVYYSATGDEACDGAPRYAGLPCMTHPAAAPEPLFQPPMPWTWFTKYSALDEPEEVQEQTSGHLVRTTTMSYDPAGRVVRTHVTGEGAEVPAVKITYDLFTGAPVSQEFVCEAENCIGFDPQKVSITYNALGRPIQYKDADANVASVAYDLSGRPIATSDGKGTQELTYDEASGVLTEMTDSAAGTFSAAYDADGQMIEQLLPDGLAQKIAYDPAGTPVGLEYVKETGCSSACTWLSFRREDSIAGQVLREESTLGDKAFSYDDAGRLTMAKEFGVLGCTTRAYTFDKDSNRLSRIIRGPKEDGSCDTESAGSKQTYDYDTADRLIGGEYDNLGRLAILAPKYSGGGGGAQSGLFTSFYVNDRTHRQFQNGAGDIVENNYNLDAAMRQRERIRVDESGEGIEIYHYAGGADTPVWTEKIGEEATTWTRNIAAIGGGLGALQTSTGKVTLQLADMHGDVVATAEADPEASELLSTQRFDEFGNPLQSGSLNGGSAEYGWLGAKGRRTQLPSGVVQMGVRSYVPELGRFLTPDPVQGGSANPYDYADQDPVNNFDLTGECSRLNKHCLRARIRKYNRRARRKARRHHLRRLARIRRSARRTAAHASALLPSTGGLGPALYHDVAEHASPVAGRVATAVLQAAMQAVDRNAASRDAIIQAAMSAAESVAGSSWGQRIGCVKGAAEIGIKLAPLATAPVPGARFALGFSMAVGCATAFVG